MKAGADMGPGVIKTDEQHRRDLEEARRLAKGDPEPESEDGARLELLAKLIDDYERERLTFRKPCPIEAILFRMEEQGLRQADIAAIVGGKNRVRRRRAKRTR
jgi:HTH-type transcriptional regulator/antitoxin HigA